MCELCEKIETKDRYVIGDSWTCLSFEKVAENYIKSPYKAFAYGESVVSEEIFYCPICRQKVR